MLRIRVLIPLVAAIAALLVGVGNEARAGTGQSFTVDTTSDSSLTGCLDGTDNDCSLRGAISRANTDSADNSILFDIADFPPGTPATISIASTLTTMTGGTDLINASGRGVIVDAVNVEPAPAAFTCILVSSDFNAIVGLQITDCLIGIHINLGADFNGLSSNVLYDNNTAIHIQGNSNHVNGNRIGTTPLGDAIHPSGANATGLSLTGDGNQVGVLLPNVISGNTGTGIDIQSSADLSVIAGNFIGTDLAGQVDLGNGLYGMFIAGTNTTIGGDTAVERNVISGNTSTGVRISGAAATGNAVLGNFIGTDNTAYVDLGNGEGVVIVGAPGNCIGGTVSAGVCTLLPNAAAYVSGNDSAGIRISGAGATGNRVFGAFIGLDGDGGPLGNLLHGIHIESSASNNEIGRFFQPSHGNHIANNGGDGIFVESGTNNEVGENQIFSNGGLGIDLGPNGVTPNDTDDPDSGANGLQNFPVLTAVSNAGAGITVQGSINSTPTTEINIQVFDSASCDPSGNGEGESFTGTINVSTDAGGDVVFSAPLPEVTGLRYITAFATPDGVPHNSSEFSNCLQVPPLVVNSAADPGDGTCTIANCTLREAMTAANAAPDLSVIHFAIGSGAQTIAPTTPLPDISAPVWINGRTQPGYAGSPIIELNGAGVIQDSQGLSMSAPDNTIEGLVINRFNEFGMTIASMSNEIRNNYIGINVAGTADLGNRLGGIYVGQRFNFIGGSTAADRNVISGNDDHGIVIFGATTDSVQVTGNYIGTNAAGTAALGNTGAGVRISGGTDNNTIGGTTAGERNVISGNTLYGVSIEDAGTTGNAVRGNYIGTNAAGTGGLSGAAAGVRLMTGAASNTIGGTSAGSGNVISGNSYGVQITESTSDNNTIQGNFIGSNPTGTSAVLNHYGVSVTDASGTLVGGAVAGARNIISGNDYVGIEIWNAAASGNIIKGNYVGTDVTGMIGLGNGGSGILVVNGDSTLIGGNTAADSNVISATGTNIFGSPGYGIFLNSDGNAVYRNLIGVAADGVTPLGNAAEGIYIPGTTNNLIGLTTATANTIAFNGSAGVRIPSAVNNLGNSVSRNSIYANGGLGIDLGAPGVTPNDPLDPDTGANGLQNFPVITSVTVQQAPGIIQGPPPVGTVIGGTLNSLANSVYFVELYQTFGCDGSGNGEGQTFLASQSGVASNGSGNANFSVYTPQVLASGSFVTAIAMDAGGSSSEFSACVPVADDADDDNDGFLDVNENGKPLCLLNLNEDSSDDALVNDGCPAVAAPEVACADALDSDADGFVNDGCPTAGSISEAAFNLDSFPNDSCGADGWPADVFSSGPSANKLDVQDLISFVAPVRRLDKTPGQVGFSKEWDIAPGPNPPFSNFISIFDITTLLTGTPGSPAYPPMLGGLRAFGRVCPFPP